MQMVLADILNGNAETTMVQPGERMHILIADDDMYIREAITEYLRREGYTVTTAEDGEAAYAILCDHTIDLLITDENMPRLHGLDLLRRLRKENHHLPVILISGCMPWDEPDLESLVTPGVALDKPFTLSRLLNEIHALESKIQLSVK